MSYTELESGEYFVTDFEGAKEAVKAFYLGMGHVPTTKLEEWCDVHAFGDVVYPRVFDFDMHYPCYADGCKNPDEFPYAYTTNNYGLLDAINMVAQFTQRGFS